MLIYGLLLSTLYALCEIEGHSLLVYGLMHISSSKQLQSVCIVRFIP